MTTSAKHRFLATICTLTVCASACAAQPVDSARLLAAAQDPANWLTFGHDYSNQRYSALAQIDRQSVAALAPAWVHQTGIVGTFQTQPLVADGVMIVTTPHNHVVALDASTGDALWRYQHVKRRDKTRGGPSNRGAALGYGKVFQATNDGRLVALDRATGKLAWDSLLAKPAPGEVTALAGPDAAAQRAFIEGVDSFPAKMPPLVARGKVIAGVISAGYGLYQDIAASIGLGGPAEVETRHGRRGYLAAFDVETGAEIWRWHTTKAGNWEGEFRATTIDGVPLGRDIARERATASRYRDAWRTGGGSTWMTPAYDPELGLLYVGTGNPSPADVDKMRPGDNLYTSSLVALDVDTGALRWHYQIVPHDIWGYDVASPPLLFEVSTGSDSIAAVGVAAKNGWFYVLDRETGALLFRSEAFVPQVNLYARPSTEGVSIAPGSFGGASWSPAAYHPELELVYVPAIHKPATLIEKTIVDETSGESTHFTMTEYGDEPASGTLSALDMRSAGKIKWQVRTDQPLVGGVLATAGGLTLTGEGNGYFVAFDAQNGERLWQFNCGAGVNAPPVSYEVDGRQFIAVAAGGSRVFGFPGGDAVFAFALPKQ